MKKLIIIFLLVSLTFVVSAQGLFKPVSLFPTKEENNYRVSLGDLPITHKFAVRFDASIVIAEINYNKITKAFVPTSFSAIGPAIGIQSYVPTSATDPTPLNNYGASFGLALGKTIYDPQFAEMKAVLAVNIWQYFKFGGTYTFNPPTDIAKLGFFIGGGITF
jgi:hypothetical protein